MLGDAPNVTSSAGGTETHPPPGPEPVLGEAPNMTSSAGTPSTQGPRLWALAACHGTLAVILSIHLALGKLSHTSASQSPDL